MSPTDSLDNQSDTTSTYFAMPYPWQKKVWESLTSRSQQLPHGLLFSGMSGIGKRVFVWRFTAWLLCSHRDKQTYHACGVCQSCQWLASGTHPDLMVLPQSSLILENQDIDDISNKQKSAKNNSDTKEKSSISDKIKVDDIRALQPFVSQGSRGQRVCVIDYADTMTVAAANALLKTLEEPKDGVYLLLISDTPAQLLLTIKSRVQKVPIDQISTNLVYDFLERQLALYHNNYQEKRLSVGQYDASQLLAVADGAPLKAMVLLESAWYGMRKLWLTTWQALRCGRRSSIAASDYWQSQLSLVEFIELSELMIVDIQRVKLQVEPKQRDIHFNQIADLMDSKFEDWVSLWHLIADIKLSVQQNVQEKLAYDKLMQQIATI
ncbi:DNA polymerase III subunit [Psychrobacter sp. I-STPA6b]|uniref:DNA polymerase III subunit n=1 Tax=Psychrobacter sp. I-STPA6b TaxID=2585718 RepID=UPI001D0C6EED|nr:DNA polymerase III subunit [Psychrobacter sp. I-STPA6b]